MVGASVVERLSVAVEQQLGLRTDPHKLGQLEKVLSRRVSATGLDAHAYLEAFGSDAVEVATLARELVVPETYFFRNHEQFSAFAAAVAPEQAPPRVLSAGCASGEEPYSIAIALAERGVDPALAKIVGVDVSKDALEKARRGRYSAWSLREVGEPLLERWFRRSGAQFELCESIRSAVRFEQRNLAAPDPLLWERQSWDVVFCRNLIMYFGVDAARTLLGRIAEALVPGGLLFLGHAETLRGLSDAFELCHTHGTFYYQRRPSSRIRRASACVDVLPSGVRPGVEPDGAWMDSIRSASERIRALAEPPVPSAAESAGRWDVQTVYGLLEHEQYEQALASLSQAPAEEARTPELRLLRAVLLVQLGEIVPAEAICEELGSIEQVAAGSHYLLALCRESDGDLASAIECDEIAIRLEPAFAMPRLHLGLVARRRGDLARARRELRVALSLLSSEDAGRLLLFGGGFSRQALLTLCESQLAGCGGAR